MMLSVMRQLCSPVKALGRGVHRTPRHSHTCAGYKCKIVCFQKAAFNKVLIKGAILVPCRSTTTPICALTTTGETRMMIELPKEVSLSEVPRWHRKDGSVSCWYHCRL